MAKKIEKTRVYFESKGEKNTEDLAQIVVKRLEEGDITAVAVATTSGRTAVTFAKAAGGENLSGLWVSEILAKPL